MSTTPIDNQWKPGVARSSTDMSAREYAAIHLRVPDSGTAWLDEMIVKANRDYFAAKAMAAIVGMMKHTENLLPESLEEAQQAAVYTFPSTQLTCLGDQQETAQTAYAFADAMLAARKGGAA